MRTTFADVERLKNEIADLVSEFLHEHQDSEVKVSLDWATVSSHGKQKVKIALEEITPQLPGMRDRDLAESGLGMVASVSSRSFKHR